MKRIILLSDGTGNSSAKLFKTNVWRLYQALDLQTTVDGVGQIACYSDGVGTSSFRPLALLGGLFGYGLKRNILHLYEFLCRHWEPGDEIWLFGFSRGAFTVRTLAGMIAAEGVLSGVNEEELSYATRDIYRKYRAERTRINEAAIPDPPLVAPFRKLRDKAIHLWRRAIRQAEFPPEGLKAVDGIAFIGVWDTVAAYGSPFAELTLAIDRFIFPLSMPNRELSPKVRNGRHALSLDDERDTFHPLLWNEHKTVAPDRIKQVWFAGMHSDVGGGYPDDALSVLPLIWMMTEAGGEGLQYLPYALERFAPPVSRSAVLHDSRQGLGGYYRYQPRRLSAYLQPADPQTRLMVDPRLDERAHLREVLLHRSVVDRIGARTSRYAPIVLPGAFRVVEPDGQVTGSPESAAVRCARVAGQEAVWDDVWRKRVVYQLTILASAALVTLPIWGANAQLTACSSLSCAFAPLFRVLGFAVPAVGQYWTEAFASNPGTTLLLMALIWVLLARSAALQRRLRDNMNRSFDAWRGGSVLARAPQESGARRNWARDLRASPGTLRTAAFVKWKLFPIVLGLGGLGLIVAFLAGGVAIPTLRRQIAAAETDGRLCGGDSVSRQPDFTTGASCWDSGVDVLRGHTYRVTLTVTQPWLDSSIPAGPLGVDSAALPYLTGYTWTAAKRAINGRWFQPHVTILGEGQRATVQPLEFQNDGSVFVARLQPNRSGRVYLWVNDAVFPVFGKARRFYENNHGEAVVGITASPEMAGYK